LFYSLSTLDRLPVIIVFLIKIKKWIFKINQMRAGTGARTEEDGEKNGAEDLKREENTIVIDG